MCLSARCVHFHFFYFLFFIVSRPFQWTELENTNFEKERGAPGWLSQLRAQILISAQVMILLCMRSSPAPGSALAAQSLLGILSLPLSLYPYPAGACALSLSLSLSLKINK